MQDMVLSNYLSCIKSVGKRYKVKIKRESKMIFVNVFLEVIIEIY